MQGHFKTDGSRASSRSKSVNEGGKIAASTASRELAVVAAKHRGSGAFIALTRHIVYCNSTYRALPGLQNFRRRFDWIVGDAHIMCAARRPLMTWTTPVLVEICLGLEISGYLPAEF